MKYLLDTNAVIALMAGKPALHGRLRRHALADFGISAIVLHELYFGVCKSRRRAENAARIGALRFQVLAFDEDDARCAGRVRAELQAAGAPIGPYDVLIAGQALARGLILITRNLREFVRVEGLAVEDWEGS